MNYVSTFMTTAAVAALLSSCSFAAKLSGPSFGVGSSKKNPTASSPSGQQGSVAAAETAGPPEASIEKGAAPPWCNGYESPGDNHARWINVESNGWSFKTLNYMAKGGCDVVDAERAAKVQEWKGLYMQKFAASEADFIAAMRLYIAEDSFEAQQTAACEEVAVSEEAGAKDVALGGAFRYALQCGPHEGPGDLVYWADKPEISELHRAVIVDSCLGRSGEHSNFALCGWDMLNMNRKRLDQQLAETGWPEYGRVVAVEFFGQTQARSEALLAEMRKKAEKDEGYAAILEAPKAGHHAWMASYKSNKAAFQAAWAMEQIASDLNRKKAEGCGAKLRPLFQKHILTTVKGKTFKDVAEAQKAILDEVGYPLATSLVMCDAMESRFQAANQGYNFVKGARVTRGPRYAAHSAVLDAYNAVVEDRPRFKLGNAGSLGGMPSSNLAYKFYELTFNKLSFGKAAGEIKSIKTKGDVAHIDFEKVKYKDWENYGCKRTRRVARIHSDGSIEYEMNCKTRTVTRTSKEEPVTVPVEFASGLKRGQMVEFDLDKRVAIPVAVYKDKDKDKLIGLLGAVWR